MADAAKPAAKTQPTQQPKPAKGEQPTRFSIHLSGPLARGTQRLAGTIKTRQDAAELKALMDRLDKQQDTDGDPKPATA